MPKLSDLTDYQVPQPEEVPADLPRVYINGQGIENKKEEKGTVQKITDRLLGLNGEERYQLWPEKVVREGLSAAHDVNEHGTLPAGLRREDYTDIPAPTMPTKDSTWLGRTLNIAPVAAQPNDQIIEQAQSMSALAGTGGLGGVTDATLGATPFLRPALKYKDRLYKGKEGQSHQDVIPEALYPEFNRMAMSGEDISHYNFGFHNDKGHFLNREDALKYGIDTGLIDPQAGKFGALTSTLMADSSRPGTAIEAMAKSEPFYSALEHNVKNISQSKMTGEQWLGTLSNKPGVKPEELDWTGLKDFLKENGKTAVTKDQIEQHLAANRVELKEVQKGAVSAGLLVAKVQKLRNDLVNEYGSIDNIPKQKQTELMNAMEELRMAKEAIPTKYHSYQLPGASNYREMLLTLPEKQPNEKYYYDLFKKETGKNFDNLSEQNKADWIRIKSQYENRSEDNYKSSHWDEPNILAHVRMNDRMMSEPGYVVQNTKSGNKSQVFATEAEAKDYQAKLPASVQTKIISDNLNKKALHLEEIQSDWHQQGRERGYKVGSFPTVERDLSNARSNLENIMSDIRKEHNLISAENSLRQVNDRDLRAKMVEQRANAYNSSDKYKNALAEVKRLEEDAAKAASGVPDAPFKKTWHELALKRMIREAAEKGYDRLSWTPGEAQAARYDLSKQVNMLSASGPDKNGKYLVYIEGKDKQPLFRNQNGFSDYGQKVMNADEIEATVGKEPAKKLIEGAAKNKNNEKTNGFFDLKDENLKIGGEGMKGFYDQIIPKSLERIGKEHGVKVKQDFIANKEKEWPFSIKVASDGKKYWLEGKDPRLDHAREVSLSKKFDSFADADTLREKFYKGETEPVNYIDIPQSLKDAALHKGFPLFSSTHMFTPIAGNPFEKKK